MGGSLNTRGRMSGQRSRALALLAALLAAALAGRAAAGGGLPAEAGLAAAAAAAGATPPQQQRREVLAGEGEAREDLAAGVLLDVNGTRAPAWRGRLDPASGYAYFAPYVVQARTTADRLRHFIVDPTNPGSNQPVLKVTYPQGSVNPSSGKAGGTFFYAYPYGSRLPISTVGATLEYDVYFDPNFDFNKGGKLPGLGSARGCGGGVDPEQCWSVRIMWRGNGAGEAYMYVPEGQQPPDFCDTRGEGYFTKCDYHAGTSFMRGAFYFRRGAWHRISLTVRLNAPGTLTGLLEVRVDGQLVIRYDRVNYRKYPGIDVAAVEFATWFGGSDDSWAPSRDVYTMFKNIRLYRLDPPSGRAAGAQGLGEGGVQVVDVEEIAEGI